MITKDCTEEVFLCYKEKVQHVHIKSMKKILNPQPLTVVTFGFALAYLDKVVHGNLGLGITGLDNHPDSGKIRSCILRCLIYNKAYIKMGISMFILV